MKLNSHIFKMESGAGAYFSPLQVRHFEIFRHVTWVNSSFLSLLTRSYHSITASLYVIVSFENQKLKFMSL